MPPFRAAGAPIKSSILLATLIPVAGRDGGADGGPVPAAEAGLKPPLSLGLAADSSRVGDRLSVGGDATALEPSAPEVVGLAAPLRLGLAVRLGPCDGGALPGLSVPPSAAPMDMGIGGGLLRGGKAPAALTALLGGPLGGGGVGAAAAGASAPAFLLTHFLRSAS